MRGLLSRLLRLQKIADFQQHELVVIGLVGIAARRERQVVVVSDDDMRGIDAIALVEVDGVVPADVLAKVQALPQVKQAKALVF